MIYKLDTRILYHAVGADLYLNLPGLIDLLQDCGNLHGEDCGATLKYQHEVRQTWVIVSWQLKILRWPYLGDPVTVRTWGYSYRQFMAGRNFVVETPDGECLAKADSHWVMLNLDTQKPERIRPDILEMYTVEPDAKLPDKFPGRVIRPAKEAEAMEPVTAADYMVDVNNHVNNGAYIRLASCYIPADFRFNCFGAEYLYQARKGDIMIPKVAKVEDGWQVELAKEDGNSWFRAQWEMKNDD